MIIKIHCSLIIFSMFLLVTEKLSYFLVFYGFVILHELAHMLFAFLMRIKIKEITFLSVGVNAKYEENINLNKELIIASAGPIISLVLAIFLPNINFSIINIIIFITNMVPIYPLDGGRILRISFIKIYGYKNGIKIYGICLKILIYILTIGMIIITVYFKNYYLLFFCGYVFLLADREIKKERIKLIVNELIGTQL